MHKLSASMWGRLYDWLCGNRLTRTLADTWFAGYAQRRITELDSLDLARVQEQTLLRLVRRAQATRFGRDHDFGRIRSIADYRRLVPLRRYEDFWNEYWRPAYPCLTEVSWPGAIPYFALTSGTTSGTTKYIPVSREILASNQRAALTTLAGFVAEQPDARLFHGKLFFLGGSTDLRPLGATQPPSTRQSFGALCRPLRSEPILAGDLSGIAVREVPSFLRPYSFPPLDLALLSDWDEKVRQLAEKSAHERITMISGVPSWLLILFQRLMSLTGKSTLTEVWPELRLIVHGGVSFEPYRDAFRQVVGSERVRLIESYPCSEGFVAFEDPRHERLRLVPDHGIFFEFVPAAELESPRPVRHSAAEVEPGVQYAVVLSTCAGLWSYVVGDTVVFERRSPPLLRFTGRTNYYLSAFGEHLISEEIEKAVALAARAVGVPVRDFHVGPVFPAGPHELGRHLYLVEFDHPLADDRHARSNRDEAARCREFAHALDRELCRLNEDYEAHRRGGVGMASPDVRVVVRGGFAAWMRAQGKLGGQHKVPRIDHTGVLTRQIAEWMKAKEALA